MRADPVQALLINVKQWNRRHRHITLLSSFAGFIDDRGLSKRCMQTF